MQGFRDASRSIRELHGDEAAKAVFYAQLRELRPAQAKANLNIFRGSERVVLALRDEVNTAEIDLDLYPSMLGGLRERFPWTLPKIEEAIAAQGPQIAAMRGPKPGPSGP